MQFKTFLAFSLASVGCFAAPLPGTPTSRSSNIVARACAPLSTPTAPYTVVASAPNTPIHYLTMNAGPNQRIILGGEPNVYCDLADQALCPPGAYTVFSEAGSLYVAVPGGQRVFVGRNGHFGFTQAHSAATPAGAVLDPIRYDKADQCNSPHGTITTEAFGAMGLMACPTKTDTSNKMNRWIVFADFDDASPPTGNRDDCIAFQALTYDYEDAGDYKAAAWAYV